MTFKVKISENLYFDKFVLQTWYAITLNHKIYQNLSYYWLKGYLEFGFLMYQMGDIIFKGHFQGINFRPKGLWFISSYWIKIIRWGFLHTILHHVYFKKFLRFFYKHFLVLLQHSFLYYWFTKNKIYFVKLLYLEHQ